MHNKTYFLGLFVFILLVVSCSSGPKKEEEKVQVLEQEKADWILDKTEFVKAIEFNFNTHLADTHRSMFPFDTIFNAYYSADFTPVWMVAFENEKNFDHYLDFLNTYALEEGLEGEWYATDTLAQLKKRMFSSDNPDYSILAIAERIMSTSIVQFHYDHIFGRVNPKDVLGENYMLPRRVVVNFELLSVLNYQNLITKVKEYEVQHYSYQEYKKLLGKWNVLKADTTISWEKIDFQKIEKLAPDSVTTLMPLIAGKLAQMGIITEQEASIADSFVYNKEFKPFIKRAQTSFGLMDDGILGRKTFNIINTTIDSRIEDIRVNMERCRWFLPDTTKKCVWVNIPNYTLVVNYVDSTKEMNVAVGKAKPHDYDEKMAKYQETRKWYDRPKDHSTPQIYSAIKYMVLNPTWTVPASIVQREMYWKMRKDSSYLRRNNYRVYFNKEEIDPDTVNWRKYKATNIPFKFVQKEGEGNALGRVKFIFYNPFSIYLHDTPQKSKFEWTERAVSHGCVRVAEPFTVAEFLLKGNKKVNYDDFRIKLGQEPLEEERLEEYDPLDTLEEIQPIDTTEIIYLHERVPVYFLYNTIFFNEEGHPVFRNDVYGYNRRIYSAMLRKED